MCVCVCICIAREKSKNTKRTTTKDACICKYVCTFVPASVHILEQNNRLRLDCQACIKSQACHRHRLVAERSAGPHLKPNSRLGYSTSRSSLSAQSTLSDSALCLQDGSVDMLSRFCTGQTLLLGNHESHQTVLSHRLGFTHCAGSRSLQGND